MDFAWSLLAVAALVFANGFFVAAEFALVTVRRTRIEQLAAEGKGAARAVQRAISNLNRYIAGTQVGITIASLGLGWIGEPAVARLLDPWLLKLAPELAATTRHGVTVAIGFSMVTALHVILGELVPKTLALQKAEATSLAIARPMAAIMFLLRPLVLCLDGLGDVVIRLFGLHAAGHESSVHSASELELLVGQSHAAGEIDDLERRMIQKTFRFSETTVGSLMVPRAEVAGLDLDQPLEAIVAEALAANHTRLPAFRGSMDHVEGVIYLNDLFRLVRATAAVAAGDVQTIVRPALFVPETLHVDEVLDRFRRHHTQMAVVIDEYGGTAGVVTLEDVVESVFGEILDQNDDALPPIVRGKDGMLTVRGDTRLVELSELLGDVFEDADADTIAGYVMLRLNRIAKVGDQVETPAGVMRVRDMHRQRITEVVITPRPKS